MNDSTRERDMHPLLDRLVAGDLEETGRRRVLAWLEDDPLRWRRCGLAFLEAQTWSEALHELSPAVRPTSASAERPDRRARRVLTRSLSATLALLLAAFGLGMAAGGFFRTGGSATGPASSAESKTTDPRSADDREPDTPTQPLLASVSLRPLGPGTAPTVHIPVVPSDTDRPPAGHGGQEIPEYVRRQWERRGYSVESQTRYVLARLPDGEQVAVPVQQLRFSPLEPKVY